MSYIADTIDVISSMHIVRNFYQLAELHLFNSRFCMNGKVTCRAV